MKKSLITALLLLLSLSAFSQKNESFEFNGQESESIILDLMKMVTKYRDEEVDSTCYRQESYQEEECGNVTKYKRECRYVPGHNECRDVSDRECNYETKYKQECHTGPSDRECRTVPGRTTCHNEPGRTVCRTNSKGEEHCRDIPGRQVCDTEPGEQVCRDVPGERICRSVPYQDYVCRNTTRRQCDYVPGRDVCENIPYQEYECNMVTKYRSIPYGCKKTIQVPYQEEAKLEHKISFNFSGEIEIADANITTELAQNGTVNISAKNRSTQALMTMNTHVTQADELNFESLVSINVINKAKHFEAINLKSHGLWMNKKGVYAIVLDKTEARNFKLAIKVVTRKNNKTHFEKTFAATDFEFRADGDKRVKLVIDLGKYGFDKLGGFRGWEKKISVESKISVEAVKDVLGETTPEASRIHKFKLKVD